MSFGFDNPLPVIAAFIVIPVALIIFSRLKNPFVELVPLGAPGGTPFKAPGVDTIVKLLRALELAGLFLLFLSAASPTIKTAESVWINRGADIVFVLDTSPSMAALDMDGNNRFNAARALIGEFARKRPSDSIGLVTLGSDAALLVPPTSDREALYARLERMRIGEMGDDTALGIGLAICAYHLEKSNAKRRAAVLITDGENNAGSIHPETAASLLNEMGISLWIIGVGSAGEVPIDYVDPLTNVRRTGIFDSRYDIESLRRLSLAGGGTFIAAPTAETFAAAFSRLDDGEITVRRSRIIYKSRPVYIPFLITAFSIIVTVRFVRRNVLGALL